MDYIVFLLPEEKYGSSDEALIMQIYTQKKKKESYPTAIWAPENLELFETGIPFCQFSNLLDFLLKSSFLNSILKYVYCGYLDRLY